VTADGRIRPHTRFFARLSSRVRFFEINRASSTPGALRNDRPIHSAPECRRGEHCSASHVMTRIRVLVVEDSPTIRHRLVEVLRADPEIDVIGDADDGRRAIELCQSLRPDVITLDMMLPVMTGLAATEYIMAYCPTPILIVSASTNRGELFRTYDALAAGAVDVLDKPTGDEIDDAWERRFLATVKLVSRIKVITHVRGKLRSTPPAHEIGSGRTPAAAGGPNEPRAACSLVALGASTGGPAAIVEILRALPPTFRLPILLVLHIGEPFGAAFADWLDGTSPLRVAYARDGEELPEAGRGRVVMAPPDRHLVLKEGRLRLTRNPERHSCRPSVDELFESLACEAADRCTACLLTGMGRDGAAGLLALRRAGAATIAQDEATSVVFGMPREAILLGAAQQVLALGDIAPALARAAAGAWPRGPA
jgi:two-component system, chemotaxis family, protein-glutamate methylesterase/glutaminase